MPTIVQNKVDQNVVTKREAVINHGRTGSTGGADRKRKPCCCCCCCCCYKSGCFRVLLVLPCSRGGSCCPAKRMLRFLRQKSEDVLCCLASMRGKQLKKVSSSNPIPSKQTAASFDSHRNQAVEDCISYLNSSTAPSSTSSSSSSTTVTAMSPPLKSTLPQTPQKLSATTESADTAAPPPHPPAPGFSSIPIPPNESSNGHTMEKS